MSRRLQPSLLVASVLVAVVRARGAGCAAHSAPSSHAVWSIVPSPNTGSSLNQQLNGVSCIHTAVVCGCGPLHPRRSGSNADRVRTTSTVVHRCKSECRDERQRVQRCVLHVAPLVRSGGLLQGERHFHDTDRVVERGKWSIIPSPNSGTEFNALSACRASRNVVRGGRRTSTRTGLASTLIESWNGNGLVGRAEPVTAARSDNILAGRVVRWRRLVRGGRRSTTPSSPRYER